MINRIWKKFTLTLMVVAFVPILYFGYQDLGTSESSVAEEALREIFLNVVTRAKDIERSFINAVYDVNYLKSSVTLEFLLDDLQENPDKALFWRSLVEKEFTRFLYMKRDYASVGLIDDFGDEITIASRHGEHVTLMPDIQKRNRLTAPYYVQAAQEKKHGVAAIPMRSAVPPGLDLRQITLVRFATKVYNSKGKPAGIIYLDMSGLGIHESLSAMSFERRRQAALVTGKGNHIYYPFGKPKTPSFPVWEPALNIRAHMSKKVAAQIMSGKTGMIRDDPHKLYAYSAVYPYPGDRKTFFVVFDEYSRDLFAPALNAIKRRYVIGGVGTFLLVIMVSVMVSRALTRQIHKLREGVEKFGRQELGHRIDIRSRDEIEDLAREYNKMADSLREYSESLEKKVEERTARVKQVERKLMQAEKLAAIGFLSAGVAHEINNPIAVIVTRLELIKKALEKGDEERVKKDLDVLRNHATRIGKIAGSLLTFSREAPKDLSAVDINEIVERVMGLIEYPITKKGIRLERNLGRGLPKVWANSSGMEQVIYNVTYNAYQATDAGTITIDTRRGADGRVELVISDTGKGIEKEALERIFEPFYTTKEAGSGTGLGLSITYGIIQDFGGSINVDSRPGAGAVFTISLDTAMKRLEGRGGELVKSDV